MAHRAHSPPRWHAMLVACLLVLTCALGWAEDRPPAPDVETAVRVMEAVYVNPPPLIDGRLDDACWRQAARLEDFFCPDTGGAPPDTTVAYVCVDEEMVCFGFHCHDATPEDIVAKETRRNGDIFRDDFVVIALDPWHQHQDFYQFMVNACGAQSEQIPGGSATKIEWRGDWSGAAARTEDGWSAEIAIPYAILPYAPGQGTFGLFVGRGFAKENLLAASPNTGRVIDPKQAVDLVGLRLPRTVSHPVVMSYSTFDSATDAGGLVNAGADVQYKLANGLTALATANPDFKQVEDVVEPVSFSYTERYLPDLRPFFTTGQSGFLPREHLLYTRRVENFDAGVKLFGSVGNETIGVLDAFTRDRQNVFAASWRHQFSEENSAKFLLVSDARTGDPDLVGYGGLAYGVDACHSRTSSEGQDSIWLVAYGARSEEDGPGTMCSIGGSHSRGSGRLWYDWGLRMTSEHFRPSLGYFPDINSYGGWLNLGAWTRVEGGALESRAWNFGVNYFPELSGDGMVQATLSPSLSWAWCNGRFFSVGTTRGRQYGFDGSDASIAYGWNQKDLYRRGQVFLFRGERAGGEFSYLAMEQGFRPAERLSVKLSGEYGVLVGSEEDDGRSFQGVLTSSYDITTERSIGTRIICRSDGVTGYAAYRQVVRRGLDIYVLLGDPDPDRTGFSPRVTVKLIRTL